MSALPPPPAPSPRNGLVEWLRGLCLRVALDRTVGYGVLNSAARAAAGPVTAILIGVYFSPEMQGFYFTFASLLALQGLAEMGLGQVLIQFASHEWCHLALTPEGRITGRDESLARLRSLGRLGLRWFSVAAVLTALGLGVAGTAFFSRESSAPFPWIGPWLALCVTTALRLLLLPVWALLEGCNQVLGVYRFRFVESLANAACLWASIPLGLGLWAPAIASAVGIALNAWVLGRQFRPFIAFFASAEEAPSFDWRREVWPMQWRMALSFMSGYLVYSTFVPILFHFRGPVEAGRMGMSWTVVQVISAIASAWVTTRVPRFGMLIARRDWHELDRQFRHAARASLGVAGVLAIAFYGGIHLLDHLQLRFAQRLLPPLPVGVLLVATLVAQCSFPLACYLRAHKREPLAGISVATGIAVAASSWLTAGPYGALGMATAYLAIQVLGLAWTTAIFVTCRKAWHAEPPELPPTDPRSPA